VYYIILFIELNVSYVTSSTSFDGGLGELRSISLTSIKINMPKITHTIIAIVI